MWIAGEKVLGSFDGVPTRLARSPEFEIVVNGELSLWLAGGVGGTASPPAPSAISEDSANGGFIGVALRDVEADLYVMTRRRAGNSLSSTQLFFTIADLAPFRNNGRRYTLDYIAMRNSSWGHSRFDTVVIPGFAHPHITAITAENNRAIIDQDAKTATVIVPSATDLAALAPQITFHPPAPFAFIEPAPGAASDFSAGPALFKVISADLARTNEFAVSAEKSLPINDGLIGHWLSGETDYRDRSRHKPAIHDAAVDGTAANTFFSTDHPAGFGGSSLELRGNVFLAVDNSSTAGGSANSAYEDTFNNAIYDNFTASFWAKGIPPNGWAGWLSKGGESNIGWQIRRYSSSNNAAFVMRGLGSDEGSGSAVNVNDGQWHHYAGTWDRATGIRRLYIDGVLSVETKTTAGEPYAPAPAAALRLGSGSNNNSFHLGRMYDVRMYDRALDAAEIAELFAGPPVPPAPEANITSLTIPAAGQSIAMPAGAYSASMSIPFGFGSKGVVEFTLSEGATCDRVSGAEYDFLSPLLFTVVSSDLALTNTFTFLIHDTIFNFDDGTLQGWRNIVWDGEAASGAGAWIELAPNLTTAPSTLNGGQGIIPVSGNNGLYGASALGIVQQENGGVNSNADNHQNTLWMRSPEFWFPKRGACEISWRWQGGSSRAATQPHSVTNISYAAATDAGWMGVALRRVRDDAFVLVKPKPKPGSNNGSNDFYIDVFTPAELAPFYGDYEAYTLELINADRANWGWVAVDYFLLDGASSSRITPSGTLLIVR